MAPREWEIGETAVIEPLPIETTLNEPSDCELLALVQGGEREAFEGLYRRHVGAVHGLAWRLAGEASKAEEITQEVFVRAWKHRNTFVSGDHFRAWLRRVAVNLRRSELRSEGVRGVAVCTDPDDGTAVRQPPAPGALKADLEQAVAALPRGAREVLVLHDVYGYKHAEVADLLGIAVGTSKVHLHRARKRLQETLR